jgi:hypothetical protein
LYLIPSEASGLLGFPGIDHWHFQILKMPRMSGGEQGMPRHRNAGDLGVAHINGPPGPLLDGRAGDDKLSGHEGNDILVWDAADSEVDGGAGTDTLLVEGADAALDLTAVDNATYSGIEVIDIGGSGDNSLTLALDDVIDFSDTTDALTIDGDAGDTVTVTSGSWADEGREGDYNIYTSDAARLNVYWQISADVPLA